MKRVVLDTNIYISALLWGGALAQLVSRVLEREMLLLSTDEIGEEFRRTLDKPKFDTQLAKIRKTRAQVALSYTALVHKVTPLAVPAGVVRDPKDEIILACAVGGRADVIVSGDKDLTDLIVYEQIPILTASQFLALLNSPNTG